MGTLEVICSYGEIENLPFFENFSLNLTIRIFKKNLLNRCTWNFPYGSSASFRVLLVDPRKKV